MLTYLLLPNLQCIRLRTQICYMKSFYHVRSADQRSLSFFHSQLLKYLEFFFSFLAYFVQPTARDWIQNQLSSSVDLCCTKRWVHQSDSMIKMFKQVRAAPAHVKARAYPKKVPIREGNDERYDELKFRIDETIFAAYDQAEMRKAKYS